MRTQSQPDNEGGSQNYRKVFKPNFGNDNKTERVDSRPSINNGPPRPPMNSKIPTKKTASHYSAMRETNDSQDYEPTVRSGAVRSSRISEPGSYKSKPSFGESNEVSSNIPRASKPTNKPLGGGFNRQAPKPAPKSSYKPASQPSNFEETKAKAGPSAYSDDFGDEAYEKPTNLKPCPSCNRKFNPEALNKHKKVCQKVFLTKAKKFNMQNQRIIDNDHKQILTEQKKEERKFGGLKNNKSKRTAGLPGAKKGKWLNKSEAFRNAMRAARGAAPIGGSSYPGASGGGYEEPDDDFVKCPT